MACPIVGLSSILTVQGFPKVQYPFNVSLLKADPIWAAVCLVYAGPPFNGVPPLNPFKPRWDFLVSVQNLIRPFLIIELDEELHFNLYRAVTLGSPNYAALLPRFPVAQYTQFCTQHQNACLSRGCFGGYWQNKASVAQFGPAAPPGILAGNGSSRWKQRAIYDYYRDMLPLIFANISISRIAIWDQLNSGRQVGCILSNPPVSQNDQQDIMNLIRSRIAP